MSKVAILPVSAEAMSRLAALAGAVPIATLLRGELAVQDLLAPWSDSTLIALLVDATPVDREAIILELERRKP